MRQKTQKVLLLAGLAAVALAAAPAVAHHSFAMFNSQKTMLLDGTIKEFQWTNPHAWIQIMVKDPVSGKDIEWSVEATSPNGLGRQGWSRSSLKPGDKAQINVHPLKDGTPGGSLMTATVNGKVVGGAKT